MRFVSINATFGLDTDQVVAYYIVKGKIKPKGGGNKMRKWNPSYPYQYTILVDEEIKRRVELLSHRDGISMSEAFRRIIMKGLSK